MKRNVLLVLFVITSILSSHAKTERFGTWLEFELSKRLWKKMELSFIPDIRFQDDFTIDKYQFDAKLSYEPINFFEFSAAYRVKTNVKKKENEVTQRLVFDGTLKYEVKRFKPSFRGRYVTYKDVNDERVSLVRPRFKVVYDIKGNKITPFTSYESYYDWIAGDWTKGRFDVGFSRKMGKFHRIGLYYRLQHYYKIDRDSINILGIDYRFKF